MAKPVTGKLKGLKRVFVELHEAFSIIDIDRRLTRATIRRGASSAGPGRAARSCRRWQLPDTTAVLDGLYDQLALVEIDEPLVRRAGDLAASFVLRGSDAVRLAAAEGVADETTVLGTGDRDLLAAAEMLGLSLTDTSSQSQ